MSKHVGQRFLLGLMVLQSLVAGLYLPAPAVGTATDAAVRSTVSPTPSDAMPNCGLACCAQADSPLGSPAAKLCCAVVCGKPAGDVPAPHPASQAPDTFQPNVQSLASISFLALPTDAVASPVFSPSFETAAARRQPSSPLFLTNSVFRI